MTAAAFAFLWVCGSLPFGILVGRALANAERRDRR